jgi:hypothetical protein
MSRADEQRLLLDQKKLADFRAALISEQSFADQTVRPRSHIEYVFASFFVLHMFVFSFFEIESSIQTSILHGLEERLAVLEDDIKPVHDATQVLQFAHEST